MSAGGGITVSIGGSGGVDNGGDHAGGQVVGVSADLELVGCWMPVPGPRSAARHPRARSRGVEDGHGGRGALVVAAAGSVTAPQFFVGKQAGTAVGVVDECDFEPVGIRGLVLVQVADPDEVLDDRGGDPAATLRATMASPRSAPSTAAGSTRGSMQVMTYTCLNGMNGMVGTAFLASVAANCALRSR